MTSPTVAMSLASWLTAWSTLFGSHESRADIDQSLQFSRPCTMIPHISTLTGSPSAPDTTWQSLIGTVTRQRPAYA